MHKNAFACYLYIAWVDVKLLYKAAGPPPPPGSRAAMAKPIITWGLKGSEIFFYPNKNHLL